jgi:hypothetical protein
MSHRTTSFSNTQTAVIQLFSAGRTIEEITEALREQGIDSYQAQSTVATVLEEQRQAKRQGQIGYSCLTASFLMLANNLIDGGTLFSYLLITVAIVIGCLKVSQWRNSVYYPKRGTDNHKS